MRKPIYADDFLRWSRIISQLSQTELLVLATMHRESTATAHPQMPFINSAKALQESGICPDQDDFPGHLQALIRTGIIVQRAQDASSWKFTAEGEKVMAMARLNDVLAEPER